MGHNYEISHKFGGNNLEISKILCQFLPSKRILIVFGTFIMEEQVLDSFKSAAPQECLSNLQFYFFRMPRHTMPPATPTLLISKF